MIKDHGSKQKVRFMYAMIAIVVIGVALWYLFFKDSSKQDTKTGQPQTVVQEQSPELPAQEFDKPCPLQNGYQGTQFTSRVGMFGICLPNGWTIAGPGEGGNESLYVMYEPWAMYSENDEPKLVPLEGGDSTVTLSVLTTRSQLVLPEGAKYIGEVGILKSYAYEQLSGTAEGSPGVLPIHTKQYIYQMQNGDLHTRMTYNFMPGAEDRTELVKAIAESYGDLF